MIRLQFDSDNKEMLRLALQRTGLTEWDLEVLLRDALADFLNHRADAIGYVVGRYPEYRGTEAFDKKVTQVANRVSVAQALDRFLKVEVEKF